MCNNCNVASPCGCDGVGTLGHSFFIILILFILLAIIFGAFVGW